MARLIIESDTNAPVAIELKEGFNSVGRLPGNDIQIDHPSISNKHCVISKTGDQFAIKDIESTNGIFVDGQAVKESAFNLNSQLQFGEVRAYFERPADLPEIYIKHVEKEKAPVQQFAEDGSPMCFISPEVPADMQCTQCQRFYSWGAINHLGISGGKQHHYCPNCRGVCIPLTVQTAPSVKEKVKKAYSAFMKTLYKDGKSRR